MRTKNRKAPVKLTPAKKKKFLKILAETCRVDLSAQAINVTEAWLYAVRKRDKKFAQDWQQTLTVVQSRLEDESIRRALHGVDEPVFHQGQVCGHIRRYSDTLLIFRLKQLDPRQYREHHTLEHIGKDGGAIQTENTTKLEARITPDKAMQDYLAIVKGQ